MTRRQAFVLSVTAALGCTSMGDAGTPTLSDSLGVSLVEYARTLAAASGRRWSTESEPVLSIGEPAPELFRVRAALFQSDGRVVLANGGSQELLLFDRDGQPRGQAGGEGGGPGEFRELTFLSVGAGDSLFGYDTREHRLSVFDRTGAFTRAVTLRAVDAMGRADQVGVLRSGEIVGAFHRRTEGVGLVRDSLLVVLFDPSGGAAVTLGVFPHQFTHWGPHPIPGGAGTAAFPLPVAFSSLAAMSVHDTSIYVGLADRLALIRLDRTGTRRITRQQEAPGAVTEAHRQRLFTALAARGMAERELEILRELRGPTTLPAFGNEPLTASYDEQAMLVTDLDGLWLQPFQLPDSAGAAWLRFDAQGFYEGTVTLPARFRPTAVRRDVVLGVYRDTADVEHVRAYRLVVSR